MRCGTCYRMLTHVFTMVYARVYSINEVRKELEALCAEIDRIKSNPSKAARLGELRRDHVAKEVTFSALCEQRRQLQKQLDDHRVQEAKAAHLRTLTETSSSVSRLVIDNAKLASQHGAIAALTKHEASKWTAAGKDVIDQHGGGSGGGVGMAPVNAGAGSAASPISSSPPQQRVWEPMLLLDTTGRYGVAL